MSDEPVARLEPALAALTGWLTATNTPYLLIGGAAVALVARPRFTADVDAVVLADETDVRGFLEAAEAFGLRPRVEDPIGFARQNRMLLLWHGPSRTKVDVSLGALPFERDSIARGVTVTVKGITLRLPRVEDLIVMKAIAAREQDFADIDTLLNVHPEVDTKFIRRWVRDFADVLEAPETIDRVERLLTARRPPRKPGQRRPKHSD